MTSSPPRLSVLLVEDSPSDAALVQANLPMWTGMPCDVTCVTTLDAARAAILGNTAADVVVLDLNLPDAIGLDAVAVLRGLRANLPIVVVTGAATSRLEGAAIRIGADAVVTKDCLWSQPHPLGHSIRTAVERHRRAAPSIHSRFTPAREMSRPTIVLVGLDHATHLVEDLMVLDPLLTVTPHADQDGLIVALQDIAPPDLIVVNGGPLGAADIQMVGDVLAHADRSPVIVVSTTDDDDRQIAAISMGADDVLDSTSLTARQIRKSLFFAASRRRLVSDLHETTLLDELTGLPTRRALFGHLDRLLTTAADDDDTPPLTILFLDLDGFKYVNDQWGHRVGDDVLRVVAGRLAATARKSDYLVRLGGDEFVLVCERQSPEDLAAMTTRLEMAIGKPIAIGGSRNAILSITIGVLSDIRAGAAADVLDQADREMYAKKRTRGHSGAVVVEETV